MDEHQLLQILGKSPTDHDYSFGTLVRAEDFPHICRACLLKCEPKSIFKITYKDLNFGNVIEACTSVQVAEGDCLPENICTPCMNLLVIFFEFKQKCEQSSNLLKEVLRAKESSPKQPEIVTVNSTNETEKIGEHNSFTKTEIEERDPMTDTEAQEDIGSVTKEFLFVPEFVPIEDEHADGKHVLEDDTDSQQAGTENSLAIFKGAIGRRSKREIVIEDPCMTLEDYYKKYSRPTVGCPTCEEQFPSTNQLMMHCKATGHAKPRNHKCDICGKSFLHRIILQNHITTHTKERNHECPVCGKKFILYTTMSKHVRIHGGEKKHICEICGKGFFQNQSYEAHMRTHTGERPFLCSYCGKGFTSTSNHLSHERQHEAKKIVSEMQDVTEAVKESNCKICNKAFSSRRNLKKHMRTHGSQPLRCNECEKDFDTESALQEHLKIDHGCTDMQKLEEREESFFFLC